MMKANGCRAFRESPRPLIVSLQFPSLRWSLPGVFIYRHVKALVEAGVSLKLVSPLPYLPRFMEGWGRWERYRGVREEQSFKGVGVVRLQYPHIPGPFLRHLTFLGLGFQLARFVRSGSLDFMPNLIHVHRLYPEGLVGLVMARRLGLPVVCTARGSDIHSQPGDSTCHRRIAQKVTRESDSIIAVSRRIATQVQEIAGFPIDVPVIYNGVDPTFRSPKTSKDELRDVLGLPVDGRLIVFVGRFESAKGAPELLEAFRIVQTQVPLAHLVIVGQDNLGSLAGNMECQENRNIHWIGEVAPDQVARYLQACDIFVFPSHAEGMPNALLEAMACGLPPVATPVGGIPEVIVDGENGFLVPVGDSRRLAERLLLFLEDVGMANDFGSRAAKTVRQGFTWERNAQEHVNLYLEVLKSWRLKMEA